VSIRQRRIRRYVLEDAKIQGRNGTRCHRRLLYGHLGCRRVITVVTMTGHGVGEVGRQGRVCGKVLRG